MLSRLYAHTSALPALRDKVLDKTTLLKTALSCTRNACNDGPLEPTPFTHGALR